MTGNAEDNTVTSSRNHQLTMEAIMSRDQRTTSHRVHDNHSQTVSASRRTIDDLVYHEASSGSPSVETATRRSCKQSTRCYVRCSSNRGIRRFTTTWLRLGSLLVTLLVVSVRGAPTMTLEDTRMNSSSKWMTPCGPADENFEGEMDIVQVNDDDLLIKIILQAEMALQQAEIFRDRYIKDTFKADFKDHHKEWKGSYYDWLPSKTAIPKELNKQLDEAFLNKLEMKEALLDAYEYMQQYAVGIEQITWDQEDHRLKYLNDFKTAESKLHQVLCEIQVALQELAVTPRPDVTRASMSRQFRKMQSATDRDLRDWMIFRDYMNGLEYVVQVFKHLQRRLKQS